LATTGAFSLCAAAVSSAQHQLQSLFVPIQGHTEGLDVHQVASLPVHYTLQHIECVSGDGLNC
jgi:hypothetical protein